ncbi:transcription factor which mediates glucose repression [Scheffersomyces stipitis CBS 6054]|uniref:Transcription factor which mediates glucose repression n=1 Tax=Scheffersomyces stipitis (strain ATCC 58785 / CBS 6054 / NBRC 10063 / NRRL Y-11545) TaxID=322104 RepID=A3GEW7_PICST|nr:transcription factor which mediates glucose repression [Scheffersomyces stipitis CBS 6054]EAZ63659.2 transcription factor which mediates glucose repression [Scheffersomyces stipitis CBS 6054]
MYAAKRPSQELSPGSKRQRLHDKSLSDYASSATETWIACGNCANTLGLVVPAIKSFENAVVHDPSNAAALCGLASSLRLNDISLNETIGTQSAIDKLNKSLESFPSLLKQPAVFKELAECYLLIGLNDQAHQAIQTALQLAETDASLWLLSAQTLIRVGARSHAAGSLTHCLSLLPDSIHQFSTADIETARAAHAELAAIAAADGSIELSIAELTATLSLPPPPLSRIDEHIALWCALSTAKERANDIAGAIQACEQSEKAVGMSPRILMTHSYLLLFSNDRNNAETAINLLSKIIDLEKEKESEQPKNDGDFLPWYLLGKAYSLVDQPRLAYDSYQVALRRASNSPITWLAVGKLYLELKQLPDALAAYSQALRLQIDESSPGTATAWDGLSCVYERCDDQLMDASDACARSASCFKVIGDLKSAAFFEERAELLAKVSKKEAPVPELRDPPDVPSFLLRDLVALLPSERIAFIQGPQQQEQTQQPQQQQQQQQQGTPLQQTPNPQHHQPQHSPAISMIQSQQTPQPPQAHYPQPQQQQPQRTPQQHLFHQGFKQEQKSPRQQQIPPQLPPPQIQQVWSPNQQPQYFYQQGPPQGPPALHHQGGPAAPPSSHRSPLNPQLIPAGTYPVPAPPGVAPPGYPYGQYVPVQGGVMTHIQQQYAPPVNNWRR